MKSDVSMSATGLCGRNLIAVFILILAGALSGCAHNSPRDPLEPINRGIYAFNDALDTVVMKPLATGYTAVLPQFVRTGVSNFFSNLNDITVIVNNVLQLKIPQALSDTGRFLINTTVGLLGFIDVASHLGLEKHNEDFGQTLGYWGIGNGPYLVLPLLGPSSLRDGLGRWADTFVDPIYREDHIRTRNQFLFVRAVDSRARLLESEKVLDAAAIDRYAFLRDAYLQRRRNLVHDGNPPPEPEDEEAQEKPKPRGELPPTPAAVLVDQFGNVVAGAAEPAKPVAPEPANSPTRSALVPLPAATLPPTSVPAPIQPARQASVPSSATDGSENSARVVKVWLNGTAPR